MLTSVHHPFDQRVFYKEAVSLVEAGYDVTLVGPASADLRGDHRGVHLVPVPVPASRPQRIVGHRRVLAAARQARADVYHVHDPELLPLAWVLRRLGHRVIYDAHENYPAVALTRAWVPLWLRRPLAFAVDVAEGFLARRLDGVVGVVDDQGPRFRHPRFAAVRNYPRLEWFRPALDPAPGPPADGDQAELVHVGSLSRDRGARFLLEVMRQLQVSHPGVRLDALGPFHGLAEEAAFHTTLREFGLAQVVRCRTRWLPYDELGTFIGRHRIGLIPGQVSPKNLTPFVPTKLFEYLACGVPVVASDLPAIRTLRALGDWGLLADPSDPRAHALAIARLLDDPAEAAEMAVAGRTLVESMCNWESESGKLLSLYSQVLGQPSRGEAAS